ncbi:tape measure protein [Pseudomonas syringae]|nr:tape measure protein [Pseudomonas syringae]
MALTSRLAVDVDSRGAEQKVQDLRKALEMLNAVGVRTGPILSGASGSMSNAAKEAAAAVVSIQNARKALQALNDAGVKTGPALNGAAGGLNGAGSAAAAAEAKIAAIRKALESLNDAALRTGPAMNGANNAINAAGRNAANAGGQVRTLEQRMTSLTSIASGLLGPLLAAFGTAQAVSAVYRASEAYTALNSRMKLVTDSAGELAAAQKAVFAIAQGAYQPLSATAELYQRIATNQKELKLTGEGVAGVVGTISKTLSISGASASAANAALIQLGQAFASGTLRGEELNSVMEQAPALAQAIARGMGKTVGELRSLGQAGLLTADTVVKALQAQQGAVDELFNKTNVTIGNSLTAMGNSFTQFVGKLDQASGASASISSSIVSVSKSLDSLTSGSSETARALQVVGAAMTGIGAGAAVLMAAKVAQLTYAMGQSIYAYYATRAATIAQAQATLNQANADVIRTRTAVLAAQADLALYRGTILQTVASGRLAEARLAEAAAESRVTAGKAGLAAAQTSLLGVMGGPLGLALVVGGLAASYYLLRDNTDAATRALDDQGLSVDEVREKFEKLSGAQQRVKRLQWLDEQQDALKAAGSALDDYTYKIERGITLGPQTEQFRAMIDEVRRGQRDLDSVTTWIESQTKLYPAFGKEIADLTLKYDSSIERNKQLVTVMAGVDAETKKAALSTEEMRAAQDRGREQTKAQTTEIEKYLAKLREQRDLFGANRTAQAEFEAARLGANDKQREAIVIASSQIDILDKIQDAVREGDKTKQASLRKELEALYVRQQAMEDVAAAEKKLQEEAARAATEAANQKIHEMRRVLDAANQVFNAAANFSKNSSFLTGKNMLLVPQQQQSIVGRSMVPQGAATPAAGVVPRKSPGQLADEALARIQSTTTQNKGRTAKDKAYTESAGQKMLDQAKQQYAVLLQQLDGTDKLGAAAQALIKWEQQLADIKGKKTLTADQKSLLANESQITTQLRLNAAAEKENKVREEARKVIEDYDKLTKKTLTKEEQKLQVMREQFELLNKRRDLGGLSGADYDKTASQILDSATTEAPKFAGIDASIGGAGGEMDKIKEAERELEDWYKTQLELLAQFRAEHADQTAKADAEAEKLKAAHENRMAMLESARHRTGLNIAAEAFSNLAVLSQSENKRLGAIGKAAAIANATVQGFLAIQNALAVPPYPLGVALAVTAGVATAANIASIAGVGFSAGGYTGSGAVDEYAGIVHKGEVVWSQADISRFGGVASVEALRNGNVAPIQSMAKSSGSRSSAPDTTAGSSQQRAGRRGETVVNQTINVSGRPDNRTANQMAAATTRKQRQASRLG